MIIYWFQCDRAPLLWRRIPVKARSLAVFLIPGSAVKLSAPVLTSGGLLALECYLVIFGTMISRAAATTKTCAWEVPTCCFS